MNRREYEIMFRHEDRYFWYRGMRRIARRLVPELFLPSAGRVLDAGAGTGANLSHVNDAWAATPAGSAAPPRSFGIDHAFEAIQFCASRRLPRMSQASAEALPFLSESFDLATSHDVLYCLPDDERACRELFRVLRPGGLLYVTVAAYPWLYSEHDRATHGLRRYSRADLLGKLARAGFEVERTTFANAFLLVPIALVRKLRSLLFAADTRGESVSDFHLAPGPLNGLLDGVLRLEAFLLRFGNLPAGVTLIARATKR